VTLKGEAPGAGFVALGIKLPGRIKQTMPMKASALSIFNISFHSKKEKLLL